MVESNRVSLRSELIENYDDLVRRLTRRLGSFDFAREALHETFLKLDRVGDETIRSPRHFILRVAINVAKDRRRAQNHLLNAQEIDALLDVGDDAPDPAQIAEARSEVEAFKRALAQLPPRSRDVLQSIAIDNLSPDAVAERLQVSRRTVESDLRSALKFCADSLGRSVVQRLGGPRPKS